MPHLTKQENNTSEKQICPENHSVLAEKVAGQVCWAPGACWSHPALCLSSLFPLHSICYFYTGCTNHLKYAKPWQMLICSENGVKFTPLSPSQSLSKKTSETFPAKENIWSLSVVGKTTQSCPGVLWMLHDMQCWISAHIIHSWFWLEKRKSWKNGKCDEYVVRQLFHVICRR